MLDLRIVNDYLAIDLVVLFLQSVLSIIYFFFQLQYHFTEISVLKIFY